MLKMRVFHYAFPVIFGLLSISTESLRIDDGLLKEIIQNYNLRVPGPLRVVDFKDIHTPTSNFPFPNDHRMNVTAVTGDGRRYKTSLLLTEVPESGFKREFSLKTGLFENCFNVYTHVVPKLEELQANSGDNSETIWPIFLASRSQHIIVTINYPNGRWLHGTTEYISTVDDYGLILRSLAKWHAMTAVLLERNSIPKDLLNTSLTIRNQHRTLTYYKYLLKNFAEVVRASWGDEWGALANQANDLASTVSKKILDIFNHPKTANDFEVLNLGDFSIDGIFFAFGISDVFNSSRPIAIRFSSFEGAHINTPALDVNSILYTMPSVETALRHRQALLTEEYHPALLRYLNQFGFTGTPPTLNQFLTEVERTEMFGVLESINQIHSRHASSDADNTNFVDNLEKTWKTGEVKVNATGMLTKEFSGVMKIVMRRAMDANVLIK